MEDEEWKNLFYDQAQVLIEEIKIKLMDLLSEDALKCKCMDKEHSNENLQPPYKKKRNEPLKFLDYVSLKNALNLSFLILKTLTTKPSLFSVYNRLIFNKIILVDRSIFFLIIFDHRD